MLDGANLTVTENTGSEAGGIYNDSGRLLLAYSVVAGNRGPGAPDCGGALTTLGHNLVGTAIGCLLDGNVDGDRSGDCCSVTCQFEHPPLAGDANRDGRVSTADLTAGVRILAGGTRAPCGLDDADGNCAVNPADLAATGAVLFR